MKVKQPRVLVVDDDRPIRELLAHLLRAADCSVVMAEDGTAGLKAIESERFDLVITDIAMPGADGWTLAAETRRRFPDTKLLIVTGGPVSPPAEPSEGFADAIIAKPFDITAITSIVDQLLDHTPLTRARGSRM
ncbi:MAG TPA: response regulator [Blastocatellia bacterium]|nr:response regulator [Blastocatellia bacterium]